MRKTLLQVVMVVVSVFFATTLYAQTDYYVQSVKAKVMSGPSFKSGVISEVSKGHKLSSSGKEGSWVKVRISDKDGYVSSLLVSTHPPFEKTGIIKGEDAEIKQGVRRRASSYTSAAAARGLAQDERRRLSKEEAIDYYSLDKVESFTLSPDEITRFMEGKKL
ncbi:MAG: SH3 domain-containing protein [Nitrospirae bacterium]|nr:SH3 domain-containing protein [Nitrospirota bacterium]